MLTVLGALMLVLGVVYPIAGMLWLSARVSRQPALTPRQTGLILALNWFLPLVLILLGVGILMPDLWAILAFKLVFALAVLAAVVTLAGLTWTLSGSRKAGKDGG